MIVSSAAAETNQRLLLSLWRHLSPRRQTQFLMLIGLMLVSSFAEVISLGAVLPFLGILTAPDRVLSNPIVMHIANLWGVESATQLVLPITVLFASAAVISGGIRMLLLWFSTRLAFATGADISIEVYRRTLYQPYQIHVARNSSHVISGIVNKVSAVVHGVLVPFPTMISSVMLLLFVTAALLAINPTMTLIAILGFGSSYGLIAWLFRRRLQKNSERIAYQNSQVIKALQEGLGGIRDVLLDGTQPFYCDVYSRADYQLRRAQSDTVFIGVSPRFIMEAVGIVIIAILAYGYNLESGGIGAALPMLGALALGAQRLLPALQQCYGSWVSIAGNHASIRDTIELLDQPLPRRGLHADSQPIAFTETLSGNAISFRYLDTGPWILRDISFQIHKGMRVGIVGRTGSGKTTLLDLLMGLLTPTHGCIQVDGRPLEKVDIEAWQRVIAHVPQNIFLADTSLAENIAFGMAQSAIDVQRLKKAARQAQIDDFVQSLPDGYETITGERGMRLSGGQRQRIGIARALYKQASILVFDEATSALDNATEQELMAALTNLDRSLTIFVIAHRLSTVRHCDKIIEMEKGAIVAMGTYEELCRDSATFRAMVDAAGEDTQRC